MEGGEAAAAGPAIVVVDDTSFFRHLLSDLLEGRGYRVIALSAGDEIADLLGRTEVAVVLSDIEMPGLAGPELLRRVKRLRPDIPVVMISSHQDFQAAREVLRDGALDYLVKPIEAEELFATVERALDVYRTAQRAAWLEGEARRRLSDLILLKEIGESASTEEDLERFFAKILDSIRDSAEVEIASLMLLEDDGLLHIRAARGLPPAVMREARVASGEGIAGHVLATGEAVLIEDIGRDKRFAPSGGGNRYQTRSLLSVPIRSRENVIGVLNVNNKRSGETFTATDEHLLTTIAHQAALAIENFQLVSSLRQQTRELEDANRQLVRFQQARSRLVCNLSHELNTPLTSILGYVDLILNFYDQLDAEEIRDQLMRVHAESTHLEKLVAGMLQLFSLDSGRGHWEWQELALSTLLEEVLTELEVPLAEMGLRREVVLAENLPAFYGDRAKAALLLGAVLDNAVKFNRPGGVLRVKATGRTSDGLRYLYLQIHNDGRAIPAEAGRDIFEGYAQLGDIDTDKPEGIGVGLSICRAVLERMKGRIILEPSAGEGTTFGIWLPTRESYGALSAE